MVVTKQRVTMHPIFESVESRRFFSASIAGKIFNDLNGNGSQNGNEHGLGGVTVFVDLNKNGTHNAGEPQTTTALDGSYKFTGLSAGTYHIVQKLPSGKYQVSPSSGAAVVTVGSSTHKTGVNLADRDRVTLNSETRTISASAGGKTQSFTSHSTGVFNKHAHESEPVFSDVGDGTLNSNLSSTSLDFNGTISASGGNDTGNAQASIDLIFTVNQSSTFNLSKLIHGNRFQITLTKTSNGSNVISPIGEDPSVTVYNKSNNITLAKGQYEFKFQGGDDASGNPFFLKDFKVHFGLV
jgi:hypothetical protein